MTEAEAIKLAKTGDHAGFEWLHRKYDARLRKALAVKLKGETEVDDFVQEGWARIYGKLSTFDGRSSFYTWAFRVTYNFALMEFRKRDTRPRTDSHVDVASLGPAQHLDLQVEVREKLESVLRLPDHWRLVVFGAALGVSVAEIAKVLKLKPNTVKSRLNRARAYLRENHGRLSRAR